MKTPTIFLRTVQLSILIVTTCMVFAAPPPGVAGQQLQMIYSANMYGELEPCGS